MPSEINLRPPIETAHFAVFGQIISGFALCESLLKSALAVILSAELTTVHTLTDKMNVMSLSRVARALSKEVETDSIRDAIEDVCVRFERASALRNKIAH